MSSFRSITARLLLWSLFCICPVGLAAQSYEEFQPDWFEEIDYNGVMGVGVNPRNGNFWITFKDLSMPQDGVHEFKIERTYNSKSPEMGLYGLGWGSGYETFLMVFADGTAALYMNGAGAHRVLFMDRPEVVARRTEVKSVNTLLEQELIWRKAFSIDHERTAFFEKLSKDQELRQAYLRKYGFSSFSKLDIFSLGSNFRRTWYCPNCRIDHAAQLTRIGDRFRFAQDDENFMLYIDAGGLLRSVVYDDGRFEYLTYNRRNKLVKLEDNFDNSVGFSYYDSGRVSSMLSNEGTDTYQYDGALLTKHQSASDEVTRIEYDSNYNATKFDFGEGRFLAIEYTVDAKFVSRIYSHDGRETKYEYFKDPENPNLEYGTIIKNKVDGGYRYTKVQFTIDSGVGGVLGEVGRTAEDLGVFDEYGNKVQPSPPAADAAQKQIPVSSDIN